MPDEIRKYIVDLILEKGLSIKTPDVQRRWLVGTNLLVHFPKLGKRNARARLNRALICSKERRGGAGRGQGAKKGNQNAKKKG